MPTPRLRFHPAAVDEAEAARDWYAARDLAAAVAFLVELETAFSAIVEHPTRWPAYMGGTRRYLLRRFPFSVVYRELNGSVEIIAIAHAGREPGYWRSRVR
jgi:plasmid stabilization system protein ParE